MADVKATNSAGLQTISGAIIATNPVRVNSIGAEEEWQLITEDENNVVTTIDFVGGRPKDRE